MWSMYIYIRTFCRMLFIFKQTESMAFAENLFEAFSPSRFISFSFPNPCHSQSSLRVAVLDSPIVPAGSPSVAAMFVPAGLETDWLFSTESGHYQLLFNSPGISRLILVGDQEPVNGDNSLAVYNRPSEEDTASSWSRLAIQTGHKPKALCIGVGGAALLTFLATHLDFEVVGVEIDMEVVRVAEQYFGLVENEYLHISIGDAIEFLDNASKSVKKQKSESSFGVHTLSEYNVIMVDLDSSDARKSTRAPPMEFVDRDVLLNARSVLSEYGIVVMNVIPPNKLFFETLIDNFRSVFDDLFQIDVDNGDNFVVIACVCSIKYVAKKKNTFLSKLGLHLSGTYMNSIKKI